MLLPPAGVTRTVPQISTASRSASLGFVLMLCRDRPVVALSGSNAYDPRVRGFRVRCYWHGRRISRATCDEYQHPRRVRLKKVVL